jgi:hypothetical protein
MLAQVRGASRPYQLAEPLESLDDLPHVSICKRNAPPEPPEPPGAAGPPELPEPPRRTSRARLVGWILVEEAGPARIGRWGPRIPGRRLRIMRGRGAVGAATGDCAVRDPLDEIRAVVADAVHAA